MTLNNMVKILNPFLIFNFYMTFLHRMDIGKQRKPSVDAKYLHAFSPSPLSQNGQHLRHPVEGNKSNLEIPLYLFIVFTLSELFVK